VEITWENETRKLSQLVPWESNPRHLIEGQAGQLRKSLERFGQVYPFLISPGNEIYDGHQRQLVMDVMADYGHDGEVDVRVSSRELTEPERKELIIRLHENTGEWDYEGLATMYDVSELRDWGMAEFHLEAFTGDQVLIGRDAKTKDELSGELMEKWGVEYGQKWRLPSRIAGQAHTILCGDCTHHDDVSRLADGGKFDMIFTDPPYGVNYEGGHFHSGDVHIKRKRESLVGDGGNVYELFLPVVLPYVDGPCYVWFSDSVVSHLFDAVLDADCQIHAMIIWHKTNATYAAINAQYKQRHEPLLYFKPRGVTLRWNGPTDERTIWEIPRDSVNDMHPTQKPIALAERAISNHDIMTVADFFAGSGSTIVAAENLGRQCLAMEIQPEYVAVSLQRYADAFGIQPELMEE